MEKRPRKAAVRRVRVLLGLTALATLLSCGTPNYDDVDLAPPTTLADQTSTGLESGTVSPATTDVARSLADTEVAAESTDAPTTTANPADLGMNQEPGVMYVGPDGDDDNDGALPSRAFRTLGRAVSDLEPGETLFVLEGVYDEDWRSDTSVYVDAQGTAEAWIRIAAFPGHAVEVLGVESNAFKIEGAAYVELSGFELVGSGTDLLGAGVHVEHPSHHIRIVDNVVHGFPAGGINVTGSSHITIEGNEVYGNANHHPGQHSGISIWRPQDLGFDDDDAGYTNYVLGNLVYDNRNTVAGERGLTDGNCVIIDQTNITGFSGRTLVANNVCVNNGGRGVNIHQSSKADVVNNTLLGNLTTPDLVGDNGELTAFESSDVRFVNNLVVPRNGTPAARDGASRDVIFAGNLFVADDRGIGDGENNIDLPASEALAVLPAAGIDPSAADYSPAPDSPAIDAGRDDFGAVVTVDALGNDRLVGAATDIGAIELH